MELNIAVVYDTLSDVFRLKSFVESWFAASEHKLIWITTFTSGEAIPLRLISSVVSNNHTVEIRLTDGKSISSTITFRQAEKLFADDSRFLLCNHGIIVNMFVLLGSYLRAKFLLNSAFILITYSILFL